MDKPRREGRGRAQPSRGQSQRGGGGGDESRPGSSRGAPPPSGAWGGRAPGPQSLAKQSGRGSRHDEGTKLDFTVVAGSGEGAMSQTRGAAATGSNVRGRLKVDLLRTKPPELNTKKGTSGKPIKLVSNYFQLLHAGKWCLYQYRADFAPDIDVISQKKRLMRTAIQDTIKGAGYLFDGTVLYTPQRIMPDPLELFVDNDGENVRITLRLVGDLAWGDGHYIQLFNIIVRKCLTLMNFQLVGRHYFSPEKKLILHEHNIQLWPGYVTSMRQHEQDILLNVDLQFKFMRTDNVYDMMSECSRSNFRKEFQSKIIGGVVLTFYNNKTYRIDDVDFSCTPKHTFKMRDGTDKRYLDYFTEKYKVKIRDEDQPMLVSRSKPREIRAGMPEVVYLVPELCQLTGLSERQRENMQLMRTLATHTRVGPDDRVGRLLEFSSQLRDKPDVVQELRRWDLKLATTLVEFPGRVLNTESIVMGRDQRVSAGEGADWSREFRSHEMLASGRLERFVILVPGRLKNIAYDFVRVLQRVCQGFRWNVGNPRVLDIADDRTSTYLDGIERAISSYDPDLVMVILPNPSLDRYSAIKKKLVVDRGVPSQVVLSKNLTNKGVMSIATKIVIQINCKVGGSPWSVIIPLSNIMVVGYDVCRDTVNKRKSFAGVVASFDKPMTRYYSTVCEHANEEEMSDQFASCIVLCCQHYKKVRNTYPDQILVYRDAVGEGQIPYVYSHEVVNIKKKLSETIYKDRPLRFGFIIVSKRINTRIFYGKRNPPPGTIVDDVITLPERYDFFIVSQCVRQGTVAPTSYNVIDDNLGLPPDRLQMLTYKLCHLYFNWSGTVRVPAPCQYAHKLAFLTSQCLHQNANPNLHNSLFYL